MLEAIITVGISASGKSTWAKAHAQATGAIISNRDDLRFSMTGANDWSEYKFRRPFELMITELQREQAQLAYAMERPFILADTNLNKQRRDAWIHSLLRQVGYEKVIIKWFDISLEEAIMRDSCRIRGVGAAVIRKQYEQWKETNEVWQD
jgi:predicted kinase